MIRDRYRAIFIILAGLIILIGFSLSLVQKKPDTSSWSTYRNKEAGYEIKYPSDFAERTGGQSDCLAKEQEGGGFETLCIFIRAGATVENLEDELETYRNNGMEERFDISIDGEPAYVFETPRGLAYTRTTFILTDDTLYRFLSSTKLAKYMEQTFKITN